MQYISLILNIYLFFSFIFLFQSNQSETSKSSDASLNLAYKTILLFIGLLKSYLFLKESSEYHPAKTYPFFVGFIGSFIVLPSLTSKFATSLPPNVSNSII